MQSSGLCLASRAAGVGTPEHCARSLLEVGSKLSDLQGWLLLTGSPEKQGLLLRLRGLVFQAVEYGICCFSDASKACCWRSRGADGAAETERLLKAFRWITLTVVHLPDGILAFLGLSALIYENLVLSVEPIPP